MRLFLALLCLPLVAAAQPTILTYTGSPQAYTVPAGITSLRVVLAGAPGGRSYMQARSPGAQVAATIRVTPGETLTVVIGQQGADQTGQTAYNGGGAGGWGANGGGGASDIRRTGAATGDYLTSRNALLVAGGAGGNDWLGSPTPVGGHGGTPTAGTGIGIDGNDPGAGATQAAAGGGAQPGTDNSGGNGGYAGGGGGYYGGAAADLTGRAGGGGGGSSWGSPLALIGEPVYSLDTARTAQVVLTPVVAPLPVVLLSFTAERQGADVVVGWATASEKNAARFEVQRSTDGAVFTQLSTVAAHGTSTQAHAYAHLDTQAPASVLYYRLRQVDLDGSAHYSPTRTVAAKDLPFSVEAYPNPWQDVLTVRLSGAGLAEFALYDALGRCVLRYGAAAQVVALPVPALPSGLYHLHISQNGGWRVVKLQH